MKELEYDYYSQVRETDVEWLWYPYIPYGKLTLLQGDPGEGKSTFILNIVALLTRGEDMPDGFHTEQAQTVIYQCSEDNASDTVKPRLIAAGADCGRVAYIVDDDATLSLDDERIEKTIEKTGARLLILDPLQSFMPQDSDMHSAGRMRSILGRLAAVAEKHGCAVVLVGHMNKSKSGKHLYRGLGSIDITAIARSVLMISRDEENPQIRYMHPIKSSLAPEGDAIGFSFSRSRGFQWIGVCDYEETADDEYGSKEESAKSILTVLLKEDMPSSQIFAYMQNIGISKRTVNRAKKEMDIISYRKQGRWYWSLSNENDTEADDG